MDDTGAPIATVLIVIVYAEKDSILKVKVRLGDYSHMTLLVSCDMTDCLRASLTTDSTKHLSGYPSDLFPYFKTIRHLRALSDSQGTALFTSAQSFIERQFLFGIQSLRAI